MSYFWYRNRIHDGVTEAVGIVETVSTLSIEASIGIIITNFYI